MGCLLSCSTLFGKSQFAQVFCESSNRTMLHYNLAQRWMHGLQHVSKAAAQELCICLQAAVICTLTLNIRRFVVDRRLFASKSICIVKCVELSLFDWHKYTQHHARLNCPSSQEHGSRITLVLSACEKFHHIYMTSITVTNDSLWFAHYLKKIWTSQCTSVTDFYCIII